MLRNKVAVITGACRGIGAATAKALAAKGVQIAIVDICPPEEAGEVLTACLSCGVKAQAWQCDVADSEAVKATVAEIKDSFSTIDILINNAGITRDGLILTMRPDAFEQVVRVNLGGAYNMIRHIAPLMVRNHWGRIVNVSSIAGLIGNGGQANYAASKAGIIGLTKSVARELAAREITCNAVAPGFIQTDMTKTITEENTMLSAIPLGHMGVPEDVAQAILFLAESNYITGEVIRIDGGLAM